MSFIWLGYTLILNGVIHYNTYDYDHFYGKFLNYYNVWAESCNYKTSVDHIEQIENVLENFKNIKEENNNGTKSRNSWVSHDSSNTLVPYNQPSINKKLSFQDLPTEFNLQSSKFINSTPSSPIASPMKKSNSSISTINCVKNYKSCSDFVDKLYSVSPQNTYYLNNATAIAAFSETIQSEEQTEPPTSPTKSLLPELERVFENIEESGDDSSIHSNETHYGGGGGGNFKFKLPSRGKLEFGGGAGFDYKHGKHANDDSNDDSNDDGNNDSNNNNNNNNNNHGNSIGTPSTRSTWLILSFINWFSWLFPPLLPIGESKQIIPSISSQERFPLLKHRLSTYSLNEHQPYSEATTNTDCESCEILLQPIIVRFVKFQYFMAYYYDISVTSPISPVRIDPFFQKYGQLLIDTPSVWIFLDEFNWMIFVFIGFIMYFTNLVTSIPILFVVKMFKINFLHGFKNQIDYRFIITIESFINLAILLIEIILFYRSYVSL